MADLSGHTNESARRPLREELAGSPPRVLLLVPWPLTGTRASGGRRPSRILEAVPRPGPATTLVHAAAALLHAWGTGQGRRERSAVLDLRTTLPEAGPAPARTVAATEGARRLDLVLREDAS